MLAVESQIHPMIGLAYNTLSLTCTRTLGAVTRTCKPQPLHKYSKLGVLGISYFDIMNDSKGAGKNNTFFRDWAVTYRHLHAKPGDKSYDRLGS